MHHRLLFSSLLSFSLGFLGCDQHAEPAAKAPPPVAPPSAISAAPLAAAPPAVPTVKAAPSQFGAPLSNAPVLKAEAVIAEPVKYDDKDIKLTGKVNAACQKAGCWMTVGSGEPGSQTVRVSFKDYGFFVPKDCMGKTAIVEGRFKVTELSVAQAQHYANDAAKPGATPQKINAPQKTLSLVATGVELL